MLNNSARRCRIIEPKPLIQKIFEILFPSSSLMTSSLEMPRQQQQHKLNHKELKISLVELLVL